MSFLTAILGDANKRIVDSLKPIVARIGSLEAALKEKTDQEVREGFLALRQRHSEKNESLDELLPEAFAHVREAAKRTLKQRHFDVQLIGGIILHQGKIAEMKTGEGKTLVATLAVSLNALTQKGVHVVTVNDYLAKRDAQWMGQIYDFLGLTVGVIQHDVAFQYTKEVQNGESTEHLLPVARKQAYACDITYGTNNEFGFDYLRDNMAPSIEQVVQRDLQFAIVDEVDSILIDEARTPLIISAPSSESSEKYVTYAAHVEKLKEGEDYNIDEKMRASTLTEEGIRKMERYLNVENIYAAGGIEMAHHVEQALRAKALYKRDKDYVVKDNEVIIVDEFTGRLMQGRRYSEGLHQAIEAKEGVDVQQESQTLATITFQNYFRLYEKLSGMTGTAATEAEEFSKIYELEVLAIPTNKQIQRRDEEDRIYKNELGKYQAVSKEISLLNQKGQPVLVGTISIEKNELLSDLLRREGIPHEMLNAKNHEREAKIIANAGKKGAVTIATNMAGRGVDIVLGGIGATEEMKQEVKSLGGLHVIGTERHESRRIDNQLRGRSGRQGDEGSSQFYVSLEDDLMRVFGSDRMKSVMERLGVPDDMPIQNRLISKSIESAQKKVEGYNFDIRKHLVEYDDVINRHREVMYARRYGILRAAQHPEKLKKEIEKLYQEEIERVVNFHTASEDPGEWNIDEIYEVVDTMFPVSLSMRMKLDDVTARATADAPRQHAARDAIIGYCKELFMRAFEEFAKRIGNDETLMSIQQAVYLRAIDALWIEHLSLMDYLRQGINLRGYGQRDPLIEYKKEAFTLFSELIENVRHQVVYTLFKVSPTVQNTTTTQQRAMRFIAPQKESVTTTSPFAQYGQEQNAAQPQQAVAQSMPQHASKTPEGEKIGRNDPCWCGSGKKFKKCHGV